MNFAYKILIGYYIFLAQLSLTKWNVTLDYLEPKVKKILLKLLNTNTIERKV